MSEHAFEKEAKIIIDVLQKAHAQISAIDNSEMDARKYAILNDLNKHANVLRLELGEDIPTSELQPKSKAVGAPLTKLFGKEVKPKKVEVQVEETTEEKTETTVTANANVQLKTAEDVQIEELKKEIDELYPRFVETETDTLLDRESDIVLRGVAKRAGLPVTEKNPKNITAKYVELIKTAIKKKADIEDKGKTQLEKDGGTEGKQ